MPSGCEVFQHAVAVRIQSPAPIWPPPGSCCEVTSLQLLGHQNEANPNSKQGFLDVSSEVSGIQVSSFFWAYRFHRGRNKKRSVIFQHVWGALAASCLWRPQGLAGHTWLKSHLRWWASNLPRVAWKRKNHWIGKGIFTGNPPYFMVKTVKTPWFSVKIFFWNQSNAKRVEITNQSLASYFKQFWDNWCSSPRTSLYPAWFGIIQYSKIFWSGWCFQPRWKLWLRQWEGWHPIYIMENKSHVWNHKTVIQSNTKVAIACQHQSQLITVVAIAPRDCAGSWAFDRIKHGVLGKPRTKLGCVDGTINYRMVGIPPSSNYY